MKGTWRSQALRAVALHDSYRRQAKRAKRRGDRALWMLRTRQAARALREFAAIDPGFSKVASEVRALIDRTVSDARR